MLGLVWISLYEKEQFLKLMYLLHVFIYIHTCLWECGGISHPINPVYVLITYSNKSCESKVCLKPMINAPK